MQVRAGFYGRNQPSPFIYPQLLDTFSEVTF